MDVTLNDQLILTRDIQQLQLEKSRTEDTLERKKRELLSALDLSKKENEKLKGIQELQIKTMNDIRQSQLDWNTEKRLAQEELEAKQSEVTKILNRESYIKLQEQKLRQVETGLSKRENETSEKERGFVEREKEVRVLELQAIKLQKEAEKLLEENQSKASELREKFLKDIENLWPMK